jgi:hypothetical protein
VLLSTHLVGGMTVIMIMIMIMMTMNFEFTSSGMWCCVVTCVFPDISKEPNGLSVCKLPALYKFSNSQFNSTPFILTVPSWLNI